MIFGDRVRAAASSAAGEQVAAACRGAWGTVGWFVPEGYGRYVRVGAPEPGLDGWWDAYRSLFGIVATVGAAHTSTPGRAWLAVWEGHGWETATTIGGAQDARRHESIRTALREVPQLRLPNRTYYLLEGAVAAVTELREPGFGDRWQPPDLVWPDDRRWHLATDVDVWALYVAGSAAFVADLVDAVPTAVEDVSLDRQLVAED